MKCSTKRGGVVGQQPAVDHRGLVGGEVVADHVDRQARFGLVVDLVEEVAEVDREPVSSNPRPLQGMCRYRFPTYVAEL